MDTGYAASHFSRASRWLFSGRPGKSLRILGHPTQVDKPKQNETHHGYFGPSALKRQAKKHGAKHSHGDGMLSLQSGKWQPKPGMFLDEKGTIWEQELISAAKAPPLDSRPMTSYLPGFELGYAHVAITSDKKYIVSVTNPGEESSLEGVGHEPPATIQVWSYGGR